MTDKNEDVIEPVVRQSAPVENSDMEPTPEPSVVELAPEPVALNRRVVEVTPEQRKPAKPKEVPVVTSVEQASVEDFEALLNSSGFEAAQPTRAVGDKIEGRVDSIGERWIYVSFDGQEGLADIHEFTDKEGNLSLEVGETYAFFVTSRKDGTYFLGNRLNTKEASLESIEISFETGMPVEGRVTGRNKGGFEVDITGVRAFCPISQIQQGFCEEPDVHLGQSYIFRVIEFGESGRKIVLSRAALLKEAAEEAAQEILGSLSEGNELAGVVTRLTDFGAFVDLGGVEGLVHRSEIGWAHLDHPSEALTAGEQVRVTVLSVEQSDKGPRISLSMKASMEDPWTTAISEFPEGTRFTGKVTRTETFGAFVELVPGVEGLVHISELSWDERVRKASDLVQPGQHVAVEVVSVDLPRRRIGLSMKTAQSDPWADITAAYQVGMEVTGTVERVQDFGAFVRLSDTVTALLPRSEMGLTRESNPFKAYREGQEVTAKVLSIEPERRRMALTVKDGAEPEAQGPSSYADSSSGFGTLGDLLRDKLK